MTPERFETLVDEQRERFPVDGEGTEALVDAPNAHRRWVTFRTPSGRIRLELHTRPVVRGQRALGGKRVGVGSRIETSFDLTQSTHTLHAFREQGDGGWEEIEAPT
jgi:hypothetical protein